MCYNKKNRSNMKKIDLWLLGVFQHISDWCYDYFKVTNFLLARVTLLICSGCIIYFCYIVQVATSNAPTKYSEFRLTCFLVALFGVLSLSGISKIEQEVPTDIKNKNRIKTFENSLRKLGLITVILCLLTQTKHEFNLSEKILDDSTVVMTVAAYKIGVVMYLCKIYFPHCTPKSYRGSR